MKSLMRQIINNNTEKWIFTRSSVASSSSFIKFSRLLIRILSFPSALLMISLQKNMFVLNCLFDTSSKLKINKCVVNTRNKDREIEYIQNVTKGFEVSDLIIKKKISLSKLNRIIEIVSISIRNNLFSLRKISEVYDFIVHYDKGNFLNNYTLYLAVDGVTPLNRVMALRFFESKKNTARLLTHTNYVKHQCYTYNFLPESYSGRVEGDFIKIKGMPWNIKRAVNIEKKFIGIIGAPERYRLFGIEYWLLIDLLRIRRKNFNIKLRLHPQAPKISYYLLSKVLRFNVNSEESIGSFASSLDCLVMTYKSTISDFLLLLNTPVFLYQKKTGKIQLNQKKSDSIVFMDSRLDLERRLSSVLSRDQESKTTKSKHYFKNKDLPTILDIVLSNNVE